MDKEKIEELCRDLRVSYLTAKELLEHYKDFCDNSKIIAEKNARINELENAIDELAAQSKLLISTNKGLEKILTKEFFAEYESPKKLDLDLIYKAVKFAYDATDLMKEDTYNIKTALSHALNELTENGNENGITKQSTD